MDAAGLGVGGLERAKRPAVAGALGRREAKLALGAVAQATKRVCADLGEEALAEAGLGVQGDDEAKPAAIGAAERPQAPERRVRDHQQARGQKRAQALEPLPQHAELRGRPRARAQVERHPGSGGGLKRLHLAPEAAIRSPAPLDERRILVSPWGGRRSGSPRRTS
jgi:hypothetical protein